MLTSELHGRISASVRTNSRVRVLTHIKKLDDCFGQFLVRGGECAPRWRPTLLASQQTATL